MPRFRTVRREEGGSRSARRIVAVGAFFALCFGLLICRSVGFHLTENGALQKVAMRQYRTAVREKSMRGKILDAAGKEMAIDVTVDSVYANPREIQDPVVAAESLARVLSVDRAALLERLTSQRKFVWVTRRATPQEIEALAGLSIAGIATMKENSRSYPNGTVGAAVLGAVGFEAEPLGGIELAYDNVLTSRSRSHDVKRDARGHLYLSAEESDAVPPRENVELTIDKTLQYIADQALAKGVAAGKAKAGQAVVVDVRTGAILALSNMPTFDPNRYDEYPLSSWRNGAIVEPHEPGSTFKVIVVSQALDAGVVKPSDILDCENGKIKIGINIVNDSHPHGKLSVADIIKVSSNIGAYKVEQKLGPRRVEEGIRSFGFGSTTGIDLPGEAAGLLSHHDKWTPIQFATIAFGQGVAATPLQMAMAFAAIANDGRLMKPFVVKRVIGDRGEPLSETVPREVGQPIRPETAKLMAQLLERVVGPGGTGTLAASLEYPIAGKTGTAQKADPRTGYAKGRYYASFVGFAPSNAPRVAVFVGIDEPRGAYYGGQVAAPVFREIVEGALHHLKVPASLIQTAEAGPALPPASSADMEEVAQVVSDEDAGRQVVQDGEGAWRVPDFRGLTMRGVLATAADADIEWQFEGSGIAVRQEPEPGSLVRAGERCTVEFRPLL